MDQPLLDLYTDYLLSSFGSTTATGLSTLLDDAISHDKITRFLSSERRSSADFWKLVKPLVRTIENKDGVLIIDDSIEEKPYTDENDIIAWHYDHSKDRNVKGINFMTVLYHDKGVSIPVAFELISKTERVVDPKTGKEKRKSKKTKNEYYREMLSVCVQQNKIPFTYVLNDVWFASAENMKFIKQELLREFIMPLKSNRKVALTPADKRAGRYQAVGTLVLEAGTVREIYLEQVDFPLLLAKQVFINEDGSSGTLYLVTGDLTLGYDRLTAHYQKRWRVEEYHKSLKQNASLEKSPTRTVVTQSNHFFAALYAYVKLEMLKIKTSLNHYALKTKIYVSALQTAYQQLQKLKPIHLNSPELRCVT
jgi:hypothetical protein